MVISKLIMVRRFKYTVIAFIITIGLMARIIKEVVIEDHKLTALFDTGSARNYVLKKVAEKAPRIKIKPYMVGIGGKTVTVHEECILRGEIEGPEFTLKAALLDEIGTIDGHEIGAIVGATAMEEWEIRIDMVKAELDLSGLRRRDFIEYCS